ncbi:MAG: hypothetical protein ACI38Y_06780 [Candidatus Methanomethylophilaceae archaeon]
MSKYRKRKSKLYDAILRYDGADITPLSDEEIDEVRGLIMCGYLVFDDSIKGMVLKATDRAMAVIDRE